MFANAAATVFVTSYNQSQLGGVAEANDQFDASWPPITIAQDANGAFDTTWTAVPATGVTGPPAAALGPVTGRITVAPANAGSVRTFTEKSLPEQESYG